MSADDFFMTYKVLDSSAVPQHVQDALTPYEGFANDAAVIVSPDDCPEFAEWLESVNLPVEDYLLYVSW